MNILGKLATSVLGSSSEKAEPGKRFGPISPHLISRFAKPKGRQHGAKGFPQKGARASLVESNASRKRVHPFSKECRALFAKAAFALIALALAGLDPAMAQVAIGPAEGAAAPEFRLIDDNGVDLLSGMAEVRNPEITIGTGDHSLSRVFSYFMSDDNNKGTVQAAPAFPGSTGNTYVAVSTGRTSTTFQDTGTGYIDVGGTGASLSYNATAQQYTYVDRDGAVAVFFTTSNSTQSPPGWISSLTYPTGEQLTFGYDFSAAAPRLQEVSSSAGYKLKYNGMTSTATFSGVAAINSTKQYCPPAPANCTPSTPDAGRTYAYTDSQTTTTSGQSNSPEGQSWSVAEDTTTTNSVGKSILYHRQTTGKTFSSSSDPGTDPGSSTTAQLIFQITKPRSGVITYTFGQYDNSRTDAGDIANRVISVQKAGLTWNYSWQYTGLHNAHVTGLSISYPGGGGRNLTLSTQIPWAWRFTSDSITAASGQVRTTGYDYDANGRIQKVTKPEGDYAVYGYDSRGNVTSITEFPKPGSPLASRLTQYGYDTTCGNPVTCNKPNYVINPKNNKTCFTYDPVHGGLKTSTLPALNSCGPVQKRYSYGQITPQYLNSSGQLTNAAPVWELSSTSECRTQTSCAGTADEIIHSYTYDNNLRVTSETVRAGNSSVSATIARTYDSIGNVVVVDGPLAGTGDASRQVYDAERRIVATASADPDGSGALGVMVSRFTYDDDGNVSLDETGYAASQSDASLAAMTVTSQTTTTYDDADRKTVEIASGGGQTQAVTQYSYGANGLLECTAVRMTLVGYPSDACTPALVNNVWDRVVKNSYNWAGEITQIQRGVGTPDQQNLWSYTYTPNGKQQTLTDANNHVSRYDYDGFDRVQYLWYPDKTTGQVSTTDNDFYDYDANSNMITHRLRNGTSITFAYNDRDQLISKTLPTGNPNLNPSYSYDNVGHQTLITSSNSVYSTGTSYTFDALGRVTREDETLNGTTLSLLSEYDAAGNKTKLTWNDSFFVTYSYDQLSRLTAILQSGTTNLLSYGYDNLGRMVKITRPNGVNSDYSYDGIGRLQELDLGTNGSLNKYTYAYSPADQLTIKTSLNGSFAWTGAAAVNRTYVPNAQNQYNAITGVSPNPTYDPKGDMTSAGAVTYQYGAEYDLALAGTSTRFYYDPMHRLVYSTQAAIREVYDGNRLVAEYNATGTLLRRYIFGGSDDEVTMWFEGTGTGNGAKRWLAPDERGSIVAVTNSSGTNLAINAYDEYGIPASTNLGRFQYTGQQWIPELGMYYFKARVYSPTLGRFMQPDQAGYSEGPNLYEYVRNDPLDGRDPTGHGWWKDLFWSGIENLKHAPADVVDWSKAIGRGDFHYAFAGTPPDFGGELAFIPTVSTRATFAAARADFVATDAALQRVTDIHSVLDTFAQSRRTTAVLETSGGRIIAGGGVDLTKAQRAMLTSSEKAAAEAGAHAEVTAMNAAAKMGMSPKALAASRPFCTACRRAIEQSGGRLTSDRTAVWDNANTLWDVFKTRWLW